MISSSSSRSSQGVPPSGSATSDRILRAIRWYQRGMEGRPSPCRFFPSCSSYAHEAVEVHGAGRGSWLAVRRLLRCRPFGPSGFDPVPEPVVDAPVVDARVVDAPVVDAPVVDPPVVDPPAQVPATPVRGRGAPTPTSDSPSPTG